MKSNSFAHREGQLWIAHRGAMPVPTADFEDASDSLTFMVLDSRRPEFQKNRALKWMEHSIVIRNHIRSYFEYDVAPWEDDLCMEMLA
jgi:hypothetical protein